MTKTISRRRFAPILGVIILASTALPAHAQDDHIFTYVQGEQLEYRTTNQGSDRFSWDIRGWVGGDYNRLWYKTQGDVPTQGSLERGEMQLRYSRMISPFWDLMLGARYDVKPDPTRAYAVAALHGLSPFFYEVDADIFVSEEGDVSARLEVEYQLLLTQKLILEPSFELNFAVQEAKELRVGPGLSDVELGLRLRYEIKREFAPYVGFVWERKVGQTAALTRAAGKEFDVPAFVAGIRVWF
jgi:copper resistance protein B